MLVHSFAPEEAKKYGILAAVILQSIRFWVEKNRANGKHFHDGRHWTYNSVKAWAELFEYATPDQIRRALECLESAGAIVVGNYNASPYDRTKWYSSQIDLANLPNENGEDAKSLINSSKPLVNQNIDTASPSVGKPDANRNDLILSAYNEELGDVLQKATKLSDKRKKAINARWSEYINTMGVNGKIRFTDEPSGVEWFRRVFRKVKLNPHWIGDSNAQWRADFDWLMNPNNFLKVVEYAPARQS